jgi:hypothetical protein
MTNEELLAQLLPSLDRLVQHLETQFEQSTAPAADTRSKVNGTLWTGTITFKGASGKWRYENDFVVPYAAIGYVDSKGFGPYVFNVGGNESTTGPGVYNSFAAGADSGVVPLIGEHLQITCENSSDDPPTLFLAVFSDQQDLIVN